MNEGEHVAAHQSRLAPPAARTGWRASARRIAVALALLSIAAGCVVNQKKEVAKYRRVLDGPQPAPQFDIQPGQPLSLEAALLLANRTDESLDIQGENYLQALIDKERAFSAFLPTISLAPSYTWVDKTNPGGKHITGDTALNANYRVFNGFQDLSNLRRAGYTAGQRKALLLDLQQSVLLSVGQTYYQILSDERSVLVLKNSVSVQNERLRDMQGRQAVGVARALDVAQTAAQAAATRVQLIQAQNNVRTARALLALLTSAPVQDSPLADRLEVPPHLPPSDDLVREAQITRQDVRAAEAQIEAARQSVQQAIGQWYPSITLNVNYFLSRTTNSFASGGVIPSQGVWNGILSANLPIFTGGLIHADVRAAWSQLRQAWLSERQVRRTAAEQVQVAYENLEDSRRRIAELRVEVTAAQEALRQAESNYSAGVGTNLDRLTAQDQLLSAQLSLVTEEINFKIYYLDLLRTQGRMPLPSTLAPPPGTPTSQPNAAETVTPGPVRGGR